MTLPSYHPFRSDVARNEYLAFYDKKAATWPVASETRMVETSYGQTFVRVSGVGGAPILVLLPGGGANSLMWIPNIAAWSHDFCVYAIDHIYDYGRSVSARPLQKVPEDLTDWLDELFSALNLGDNISLIGGSHGGWLASQYALQKSYRLQKLVLMAPAGTILPVSAAFIIRALLSMIPNRYFKQQLFYWIFNDLLHKHENGRQLVEESIDEFILSSRCFKPTQAVVKPTVLTDRQLQQITIPTLFIVGEHDKIYSPHKVVQRLNRIAPHIKTVLIPKAGHDFALLQKELVNNTILEFLKSP